MLQLLKGYDQNRRQVFGFTSHESVKKPDNLPFMCIKKNFTIIKKLFNIFIKGRMMITADVLFIR